MDTITSYKEYIVKSIPKIQQYEQESFCWRTDGKGQEYAILKEMKEKHTDFAEAIDRLDEKLSRDSVSRCYKDDYYTGVIATLMWGGYHKILYTRRQLDAVLSTGKGDIEKSIAKIDKMLSENRINDAFLALESGDCHIKGISTSFLTKILYFLGKGKSLTVQPIIYDNVQRWTHAALLIDDNAIKAIEYYKPTSQGGLRGLKNDADLYVDYIQRINLIGKTHDLTPDRLEAYLFGTPTRSKKDTENPRLLTREFVKRHI